MWQGVANLNLCKKGKEEICEDLRKSLVFSMKRGENYVLYCKKETPNWREMLDDEETFPVNKIFNRDEWFKEENYL